MEIMEKMYIFRLALHKRAVGVEKWPIKALEQGLRPKVIPITDTKQPAAEIKPGQSRAYISLEELAGFNCIDLLDEILHQAIQHRASDIHIECRESDIRLRFRIDGMMYQVAALEREVHPQLISRLKILAGMDIENGFPRMGHFEASHGKVDCRVSPCLYSMAKRR